MDDEVTSGEDVWRQRLKRVVSDHGGPSTVARLSETPLQTLKNHLHGRTKRVPLADLTRIATACGVAPDWLAAIDDNRDVERPSGPPDGDVVAFSGPPAFVPPKRAPALGRWLVTSRALDLAGVLPGDIVDIALGSKPVRGELVIAQIRDGETGAAETIMRLFEPPYLMVRTTDPSLDQRPIRIDQDRVRIVGAFQSLIRNRTPR